VPEAAIILPRSCGRTDTGEAVCNSYHQRVLCASTTLALSLAGCQYAHGVAYRWPVDSTQRAVPLLMAARPNPCRSLVDIDWALANASVVDLSVFDVQGRRLQTLITGPQAPGTHVTFWDSRGVPAGTYIVRLRLDGALFETKIICLR